MSSINDYSRRLQYRDSRISWDRTHSASVIDIFFFPHASTSSNATHDNQPIKAQVEVLLATIRTMQREVGHDIAVCLQQLIGALYQIQMPCYSAWQTLLHFIEYELPDNQLAAVLLATYGDGMNLGRMLAGLYWRHPEQVAAHDETLNHYLCAVRRLAFHSDQDQRHVQQHFDQNYDQAMTLTTTESRENLWQEFGDIYQRNIQGGQVFHVSEAAYFQLRSLAGKELWLPRLEAVRKPEDEAANMSAIHDHFSVVTDDKWRYRGHARRGFSQLACSSRISEVERMGALVSNAREVVSRISASSKETRGSAVAVMFDAFLCVARTRQLGLPELQRLFGVTADRGKSKLPHTGYVIDRLSAMYQQRLLVGDDVARFELLNMMSSIPSDDVANLLQHRLAFELLRTLYLYEKVSVLRLTAFLTKIATKFLQSFLKLAESEGSEEVKVLFIDWMHFLSQIPKRAVSMMFVADGKQSELAHACIAFCQSNQLPEEMVTQLYSLAMPSPFSSLLSVTEWDHQLATISSITDAYNLELFDDWLVALLQSTVLDQEQKCEVLTSGRESLLRHLLQLIFHPEKMHAIILRLVNAFSVEEFSQFAFARPSNLFSRLMANAQSASQRQEVLVLMNSIAQVSPEYRDYILENLARSATVVGREMLTHITHQAGVTMTLELNRDYIQQVQPIPFVQHMLDERDGDIGHVDLRMYFNMLHQQLVAISQDESTGVDCEQRKLYFFHSIDKLLKVSLKRNNAYFYQGTLKQLLGFIEMLPLALQMQILIHKVSPSLYATDSSLQSVNWRVKPGAEMTLGRAIFLYGNPKAESAIIYMRMLTRLVDEQGEWGQKIKRMLVHRPEGEALSDNERMPLIDHLKNLRSDESGVSQPCVGVDICLSQLLVKINEPRYAAVSLSRQRDNQSYGSYAGYEALELSRELSQRLGDPAQHRSTLRVLMTVICNSVTVTDENRLWLLNECGLALVQAISALRSEDKSNETLRHMYDAVVRLLHLAARTAHSYDYSEIVSHLVQENFSPHADFVLFIRHVTELIALGQLSESDCALVVNRLVENKLTVTEDNLAQCMQLHIALLQQVTGEEHRQGLMESLQHTIAQACSLNEDVSSLFSWRSLLSLLSTQEAEQLAHMPIILKNGETFLLYELFVDEDQRDNSRQFRDIFVSFADGGYDRIDYTAVSAVYGAAQDIAAMGYLMKLDGQGVSGIPFNVALRKAGDHQAPEAAAEADGCGEVKGMGGGDAALGLSASSMRAIGAASAGGAGEQPGAGEGHQPR